MSEEVIIGPGQPCQFCGEDYGQHVPRCPALAQARPTGIEALVCADIAQRQALGLAKYGMTLAQNPADLKARLTHAYHECLDQALYLKWAIEELGKDERPSHREVP